MRSVAGGCKEEAEAGIGRAEWNPHVPKGPDRTTRLRDTPVRQAPRFGPWTVRVVGEIPGSMI